MYNTEQAVSSFKLLCPSTLIKILFLAWSSRCLVANNSDSLGCKNTGKLYSNVSCEGDKITLSCPKGQPWLTVESARFGRTLSEEQLCLRPGNLHPKLEPPNCVLNVAGTVEEICDYRTPCVFKVNNTTLRGDPCPSVYKYLWVRFSCNCHEKRTRMARATVPTCTTRKRSITSSIYTFRHPTPTLTAIDQSIAQNLSISQSVSSSSHLPIGMTITPTTTASTQSFIVTSTISANNESLRNFTSFVRGGRGKISVFFILLELFAIYNEAANEDPPMALMWCFIGILLGLFIITMVFLVIGLRKKPKNKKLFRLSQLDTDESEIQSPTIHTTAQFPEPPAVNGRQEASEKVSGGTTSNPVSKHFPGMSSWSDLLKTDTSLYINPLWRGFRDGYQGLDGGEELNTARNDWGELSRSEPWNLSGVVDGAEEGVHGDGEETTPAGVHGSGGSNGTSSISGSGSQENTGSHGNSGSDISTTKNNEPPDINPEQIKSFPADTDLSRASASKRRSNAESDNLAGAIPVGIPSLPVPDSKIFHTEPTRTKPEKPVVDDPKPVASNARQPDGNTKPELLDDGNELKEQKPRSSSSSGDCKLPGNKLLSKFGLNSEDMGPACNTALSSPCLYIKDVNEEISEPGKQDLPDSSNPGSNPTLKVRSRPLRCRSLDLNSPQRIASLHHTHAPLDIPSVRIPTACSPTTQNHSNPPPPFVKKRNNPNLSRNALVHDKPSSQVQGEIPSNLPVTKPKKRPSDSRASSGYYSNNPSPLVECPVDITNSQNSGRIADRTAERDSSLKQKMLVHGDDDLPPLPPPPPPLIPISPLPHMCMSSYRGPASKEENNNNPAKTGGRKVHFKSSK
ncbi:uncharacterized protein LOC114536080 [Dendronephthya gigantea]|uniref:uncharacterized protein LOC114536080 n=1 Tax=Dendronephthya gigantea TaxID=151771 RepID=UPI00106D2085|nr:uncharacterized protein LOC114536080 [Dendronephthya gigantea]